MLALFTRLPSPGLLRAIGLVLAFASVILPALPGGLLLQQPPFPLAVLWAAYGWAAEDQGDVRSPILLAVLGLIHDQLSGGPLGLFVVLYCSAYLFGRIAAVAMSAQNLVSLWGGFIVTALISVLIASLLGRWALGPYMSVRPYAEAVAITALLFPLARPFYMSSSAAPRAQMGLRT